MLNDESPPGPGDARAGFLRSVLDAIPSPVLIVDDDLRVLDSNAAGTRFIAETGELVLKRRTGEVLHCIHTAETPEGCGHSTSCTECVIRNSVREAFQGRQVSRRSHRMQFVSSGGVREVNLLVTSAPFTHQGVPLVLLILEDFTELATLRRIVPMCASCRKIRDGQEYWHKVELYFQRYLDIDVTHGICPECEAKLYPEFVKEKLPG